MIICQNWSSQIPSLQCPWKSRSQTLNLAGLSLDQFITESVPRSGAESESARCLSDILEHFPEFTMVPIMAATFLKMTNANAAFWSICLSLVTVVAWQVMQVYRDDGYFSVDPLWPGLLVSAVTLFSFNLLAQQTSSRCLGSPRVIRLL